MEWKKIGHRGASGYVAENTLESIQKALEFEVDAIEVDVHRCKSSELVVIHDFTLERTTNGTGEVSQKTLSELRSLKVEDQFTIPLLTEVLELIQGKCRINIELKGSNTSEETCRIIKRLVSEKSWSYDDFIVSSFQQNELVEVFDLDKSIQLGILSKANVSEAIELGKILNAKAIHPSSGIITRENVKKAQNSGFKVNVWTVNEPKEIERMKNFGVDGIISDFPDRL